MILYTHTHTRETLKEKRIQWIDYLKAFACLLVVLGHLIQSLQKANIDNNIEITSFISWFIYLFHMPLFMCMSGFLYCKTKKDFTWENYKNFEFKKIINLIVPYITFYIIYFGLNFIFSKNVNSPKSLSDLAGIFNNPMAPYWFLYALLSIFIVIPLIEKVLKNNNILIFSVLFIFKVISIFFKTNIYFLDSIMSYSIYFYLGTFINESKENIKSKFANLICIIIYVIMSVIYYRHNSFFMNQIKDLIGIVFAIIGILICVNIFKAIEKSKILDTFKKYTFQIYLTHTIFAVGFRILLFKLNITNYYIHFVVGLLASIYIPVLMSIISEKIKYTEIFFYPIKTIKELRERKNKNAREET